MIGIFEPELSVVELISPVGKWLKVTKITSKLSEMSPIKQRGTSLLRSYSNRSSEIENYTVNNANNIKNIFKTTKEDLYIGYLGSVSTKEPAKIQGITEGSCFNAYALLGIWRYDKGITKCLFVTEAEFVTEIGQNERIYKVNDVLFVPLITRENEFSCNNIEKENDEVNVEEQLDCEFEKKIKSVKIAENMILSIFRRGGFYFSTNPNVDITRSIRQSIKYGSKSGDLPEERFCWNYNFLMPLYEGGSCTSKWATPLLSGYVGFTRMHFEQATSNEAQDKTIVDFLLISRRDCRRQGVRYLCRGANSDGNVSNSVETEQIILVRRPESIYIYSYLQYRGSIPIIWRQPPNLKKTPPVEIYKGERCQQVVLNRHFNELSRKYCNQSGDGDFNLESEIRENSSGKILVINLIDYRRDELNLGLEFEKYLDKVDLNDIYCDSDSLLKKNNGSLRPILKDEECNKNSNIKFCWFDFHSECSKMRWSNLKYLIKRLVDIGMDDLGITSLEIQLRDKVGDLSPIIGIVQGHYSSSDNEFKVVIGNIQDGICRTNCIDCLDRTNVVQSVIGRRVTHNILKQILELKLIDFSTTSQSEHGPAFEPLPGKDSSNESIFRQIWSNNADALSRLYSGTPAQKTDFTRYGKRTKKGALQDSIYSIIRFLLNSLIDGYTQDAYYVFTNQCSSPNSDLGIKKNIHNLLLKNKNKYLSPPVMIALGQYLMLVTFLLLFPIVQLLFTYSQTLSGNLACMLLDIIYIPSKLIFHYYDTKRAQYSYLNIIPTFTDYFFNPNECPIHDISGSIISILLLIFGFIQFLKYKGPKVATKPLLDETNSQIWKKQENKQ
ncbi:Sac1p family [Cryptosporidium sp. chipmunk genotype I]|uniref:Sac1p family n=1 Tax=Cryptosporidium sp. chipmunk genotype I TaxID=1280935 RepID=UPI003519E739|nr:Sac1p family [Cryptosporidium sp. chipmunk genotype I]